MKLRKFDNLTYVVKLEKINIRNISKVNSNENIKSIHILQIKKFNYQTYLTDISKIFLVFHILLGLILFPDPFDSPANSFFNDCSNYLL